MTEKERQSWTRAGIWCSTRNSQASRTSFSSALIFSAYSPQKWSNKCQDSVMQQMCAVGSSPSTQGEGSFSSTRWIMDGISAKLAGGSANSLTEMVLLARGSSNCKFCAGQDSTPERPSEEANALSTRSSLANWFRCWKPRVVVEWTQETRSQSQTWSAAAPPN